MEVNSTSNQLYANNTNEQQTKDPTQLDKNAFLEILVNQLRYQNPMEPQDSSSFIKQMVQFSTIEQLTNVSNSIEEMKKSQELTRAASLVGKEVTVIDENDRAINGLVDEVDMSGDESMLSINGSSYSLDRLYKVNNSEGYQDFKEAISLIGKQVTVADDGQEKQGIVEKVTMSGDRDTLLVVGGNDYKLSQLVSVENEQDES